MKNDESTKVEGYWNNAANHYPEYPIPVHSDTPFEQKDAVLRCLEKVEGVAKEVRYRGWSTCRCCAIPMGASRATNLGCVEYELKDWAWPEGLKHYIEVHNVKPSDAFLKEILGL